MTRFADAFIALSILVVAASAGVVLRFQVGLEPRDAATIAFALAAVLFGLRLWGERRRARQAGDLDLLAERLDRVRGEVDELARRMALLEGALPRRVRDEVHPVLAEVDMLGTLLRQVTETVADLELRSLRSSPPPPAPASAPAAAAPEPPRAAPRPEAREARPAAKPRRAEPALPRRFAELGERGFLDLVRRAVDANRIDIFLQPIVTLPQRKVRFYECFSRLRSEDGETIFPSDYLDIAERAGLMPTLDNQILLRSVHLLRRLASRSRDVGLFCNISPASLASAVFFRDVMAFLEENRGLAEMLILELPQATVQGLGAVEIEALSALAEMGFRFSVDQVTDLRGNFALLQARGFRFAKMSADLILESPSTLGSDIHPADLASHFARLGIDLIVDQVETEAQVVDLLEYNPKYGQGFVFSPPRPVRNEMTQGADAPEAPPPAAPARPTGERRGAVGRAMAARQ
jgi:cyclic-di-GMP phosphodiesterase TipF (flagellum assembly factor)